MANIKIEELPLDEPQSDDVNPLIVYNKEVATLDTTFAADPNLVEKAFGARTPTVTHYVKSEADIINALDANFEVPAGEGHTIYFDDSFTFTKGFKLNTGSSIQLSTRNGAGIFCTFAPGTPADPLISGITSSTEIGTAIIDSQVKINSTDSLSPIFDLLGDGNLGRIDISNVAALSNFYSVGHVKNFPAISLFRIAIFSLERGLVIEDCGLIEISVFSDAQDFTATAGRTMFSIIARAGTITTMNFSRGTFLVGAGESAFYIDGGVIDASSRFNIDNANRLGPGELYKTGVSNTAVTGVTDVGGFASFTVGNSLIDGEVVNLNAFSESTYNVTTLPTSVSGSAILTNIPFVADDTGNFNTVSLDQTSLQVNSEDNPNDPDSMTIGGYIASGATAVMTIGAAYTDLILPATRAALSYNQRIEYTGNVNGEIEYTGLKPQKTIKIPLSLTLDPVAGGDADDLIKLLIDRGAGYVDLPDIVESEVFFKGTNVTRNLSRSVVMDTGDKVKWQMKEGGTGTNVTIISAESMI